MDQTVHELYSSGELAQLEQRARRALAAMIAVAAGTLAGCVALCCLIGRFDAALLEKAAVALSILGSWVVIYLGNNTVRDRKHELTHAKMLLEGERETLEGVLAVSKQRMRIRGSIRFYALTLTDGEETHRSKVVAARAPLLRAQEGKRVRLYVVNGYAAAWEES